MATTVDTTPSASLQFNDTATGDTITVMDGPPESGFQTTDIATAANGGSSFILANKTADPGFFIHLLNEANKLPDAIVCKMQGLYSMTLPIVGAAPARVSL
jgi:hypothetical protein